MQSSNDRPHGAGDGPESAVDHRDGPAPAAAGAPRTPSYADPWYAPPATGRGGPAGAGAPEAARSSMRPDPAGQLPRAAADVYLEVQRSAAFREVRSRYRRFVVPAVAAFFGWYVAYVVTATTAPALMARPVAGAVNVAMLAGLGQFATTFLLTWAYARHARLRRDRTALELRWNTQELTRGARGGTS
ncbi:DUF485 domain-containing protein [Streptomyces sp. AC627_RSS907]|uniref:DUF485 domain-containing protein n=1 Tax=Streptomyces sp. AC627_RSS907 TaxID=2823684 RepID=UPI001C218439|nr:DUF485 domain-containing protein [Streptomyces sp. AC627_RSS907]